MSSEQQTVLFFVFIGFFVLIGIASLSVLLGYPKNADRRFKQAAVVGFVGAVLTAVIGLFKATFSSLAPPAPPPIIVTLVPPKEVPALELKAGKYQYDELDSQKKVVTREGAVVPVLGAGNWQVELSAEVANKPMHLHLQDEDGNWWQTGSFYPNYIKQDIRTGKAAAPISDAAWHAPGVALVSAAAPDTVPQQQAATRFNNYARKIEDRYGKPYYEWRVFVDEPQKVLDSIEQVDYVLHPTFPEPFQTSRDRKKNFELTATGWGGFTIVITIHYVDGHVAKTSYFLDLQKSWPAVTTASKPLQLKLDRIVANQDGSAGSTGWVFDILLDGRKLLHLPNRSYDDGLERSKKGNTYGPDGASWVVGPVRIGSGQSTRIDVIGQRSSGHDKATGTATLPASGGALAVNVVNAADRKKGSFTFYFSTVSM